MRRGMQLVLGSALTTIGTAGLIWTASGSQAAPQPAGSSPRHDGMHRMMEGMHGAAAVNRMHEMPGGEQMMEACSDMMGAAQGMDSMMDRRAPQTPRSDMMGGYR